MTRLNRRSNMFINDQFSSCDIDLNFYCTMDRLITWFTYTTEEVTAMSITEVRQINRDADLVHLGA